MTERYETRKGKGDSRTMGKSTKYRRTCDDSSKEARNIKCIQQNQDSKNTS
jgi:hypothetical protein